MHREKLIKYGIEIRRQKKLSKFKDLRREFQKTAEIESCIEELMQVSIRKESYYVMKNILQQLNENLVSIFSNSTSSEILTHTEGEKEIKFANNGSTELCNLFKSVNLRGYLYDIFQVIKQEKMKLSTVEVKSQDELANEVVTLIGLVFKEPSFLIGYFPLFGIGKILLDAEKRKFLDEEGTNNDGGHQEQVYLSLDLLEEVFFYIKRNFSTLNQILENTNTFLTFVHSLIRILQHFTLNSIITTFNTKNIYKTQNDDSELLNYFYEILKSNTFEHFLKLLIEDIIEIQNENNFITENGSKIFIVDFALCDLLSSYIDFVQKVHSKIQLEEMFAKKLLNFTSYCLKKVHKINIKNYIDSSEPDILMHETENEFDEKSYEQEITLRMLFSLHNIVTHEKIFPSNEILNVACTEIMVFLHNAKDNTFQKRSKKDEVEKIDKLSSVRYYFGALLCEINNQLLNPFELIGCLYNLVSQNRISLEELFTKSLGNSSNEGEKLSFVIDANFVKSFFESISQEILELQGVFYNERIKLMYTIFCLFFMWYEIAEIEKKEIKKKNHAEPYFTTEFMLNLSSSLLNYLNELKSDISTNKELLESSIYQSSTENSSSEPILSKNISDISILETVEEWFLEILKDSLQNYEEIEI